MPLEKDACSLSLNIVCFYVQTIHCMCIKLHFYASWPVCILSELGSLFNQMSENVYHIMPCFMCVICSCWLIYFVSRTHTQDSGLFSLNYFNNVLIATISMKERRQAAAFHMLKQRTKLHQNNGSFRTVILLVNGTLFV